MVAKAGVRYSLSQGAWRSPGRNSEPPGQLPVIAGPRLRVSGAAVSGPSLVVPPTPGDFSNSNPPWLFSDASVLAALIPAGVVVVDLITGSGSFRQDLINTLAVAGRRCVVRLPGGIFEFTAFVMIGVSGDPTYAFGFWDRNLQGFLGTGPTGTFVRMRAGSMTQAQLDKLATMTAASFSPNQMGLIRFDGSQASPVYLIGVTFQAADQQMMTVKASDVPAVVPQPAPHQGVVIYYNSAYVIAYCRFQAAGRAMTSSPPFEHANLSTAQSWGVIQNTEFDGRRAPEIDPARPRRCGPLMANNELEHFMTDVWMHDTNVSRYAVNDQNQATQGHYTGTRVKLERITNTQNVDPNLNGGQSLGGWTNASDMGWESCNGTIDLTDMVLSVDNPNNSGQFPAHLQLTSVGSRDPQGGRMHVKGGTFRHTTSPQLDGYLTFRIATSTYWWRDGVATTLDVRRSDNTPLTGWNFTGTWPPTAAQIAAAGISPSTHYIYKGV